MTDKPTWLEEHTENIKFFLTCPSFYEQPLQHILGLSPPFLNAQDCENAYLKTQKFVRTQKNPDAEREAVTYALAFAIAQYCITRHNYSFELREFPGVQRRYYRLLLIAPLTLNPNESLAARINDITGSIFRLLHGRGKFRFDFSLWMFASIAPNMQHLF
jgi:hypothetical protein